MPFPKPAPRMMADLADLLDMIRKKRRAGADFRHLNHLHDRAAALHRRVVGLKSLGIIATRNNGNGRTT